MSSASDKERAKMGRSASCFKAITCSSDDVDKDDFEAPKSKGSSDRRGWSFRKRSPRHRVLSNTVASETSSYGNKESPGSATVNLETLPNSTVPEKVSVLLAPVEKPQLSTSVDLQVSEVSVSTESICEVDAKLESENNVNNVKEFLVIAIQSAIRGFMAQAAFLKLKKLVKLQAFVRGHLVRRHAVGTLRCVLAIVKVQALVRARWACFSLEGTFTKEKVVGDYGKDSRHLGRDHSISKLNARSNSIEKLLCNGFARQLLESTQKTKPIHIRCDPSRPNSAWIWLERWMSVPSSKLAVPEKPGVKFKQDEQLEHCTVLVATEVSTDIKPCIDKPAAPFEGEESLITYDAETFEFQAVHATSASVSNNLDQPWPENTCNSSVKDILVERDLLIHVSTQSDGCSQTELNSLSAETTGGSEQSTRFMKISASEQIKNEGKKFVSRSRKGTNPALIAVQSEFEDLSLTDKSGKSISSSNQAAGVETNIETVSPAADAVSSTRELSLVENSIPQNPRAQVGGSERGTELSVTSTLVSPEISESGALQCEHEAKGSTVRDCYSMDKDFPTNPEPNSSNSLAVQPGKIDGVNDESANLVAAVDSIQVGQKPERSRSDLQAELGSVIVQQVYRSSPEASPRSHTTIPESQGTPASKVSLYAKRKKAEKNGLNNRSRSLSATKKSPSSPSQDSGSRSCAEQLPKDQKIGKSDSSFGSAKADNVDQEPRDSSSNSLPSYMQPTESARAKAHATSSPRSSPDVQDKDIFAKKRHSLPGANGKPGSPRIQRSTSQAQQGAKGNGSHSPHEKKWQR